MEETITLEALIQELEARIPRLYEVSDLIPYYIYTDMDNYHIWLATTKRYIGLHYPQDKDIAEFERISNEELSPNQQNKLLGILKAFATIPTVISDNLQDNKGNRAIQVTANINNSNSQMQNQQQSLAVELFLEAIKDDLTERQIKELKTVVAEADNDMQKARSGIIEKLKSFGADVASNIVANLLTNPAIWGGL